MFFDDYGDSAAEATALTLPANTTGSIEIAGDMDWYSFTATAGEKFEFQVAVYDEVPTLTLYDTDGVTQLEQENYSSSILWNAPSNGVYYLSAEHYFSLDPGTYELLAKVLVDDDGDSATALALPAAVSSSIAIPGDQDWFSFYALSGETYLFEAPNEDPDTVLTLYDTDGTTQLEQDEFFNARIMWIAPSDGTYFLSIENFVYNGFGDYVLMAEMIIDDYADTFATADSLIFPADLAGTIETQGDQDWFSFSAIAGRTYNFEVPNFENFVYRVLYDNDGTTELRRRRGSQDLFWVAPNSGTYYLAIESLFGSDIGSYELTAADVTDDHGDDAATATTLDSTGSSLFGTIDVPGDHDWFGFNADANSSYQFIIPSSDETTELTLFDTDGITQLDHSRRGSVFWVAPSDGTYYVSVNNFSSREIGAYELLTTLFSDNHGDDLGTATQLQLPAFVPSAVDTESDQDWFSFNAVVGETYRLDLNRFENEHTELIIYDTDGTTQLEQDTITFGIDPTTFWLAPSDGTYYLSVAGLGVYDLSVSSVNDDHGENAATATALALPANISGTFETPDDKDWYSFTAVAGEKFEFGNPDLPSGRSTNLNVFDVDGTTVLLSNESVWITPSSGTYFLSLEGFDRFGLEDYELSINVSIDDHGDSAERATPVGFPAVISGDIELEGDQDWFRFDAAIGTNYLFDATNSNHTLMLTVFASDGITPLVDGLSVGTLIWKPPSDGTYYLSVESRFSFELPQYELSTTFIIDDNGDDATAATLIDVDTTVNGSIETREDVDWFRFNAIAGTSYRIALINRALAPNRNGRLALYDTDGVRVLDSAVTTGLQFVWLAPNDGPRFISVSGWLGNEIFDYEVFAVPFIDDHRNAPAEATSINLPANILGNYEWTGDEDWFRFDATAGEEFIFEIPRHDDDVTLAVYDTNGSTRLDSELVTFAFDSGVLFWTAPSAGTFFLSVDPRFANGAGAYNLLATSVTDDFGDDAATASPLVLPANISGAIEYGGDPDWFSFNAVAGEQFYFAIPDHDEFIRLQLHGTDGITQLEYDHSYTPYFFWLAPSDGTYFVSIEHASTGTFGDYQFVASAIVDDHGDDSTTSTLLQFPLDVAGSIESPDDRDWYRFDAVGDLVYDFRLELEGLSDGELSLYDSNGSTVLVDARFPEISWVAPNNGPFYLVVGGDSSDDFGNYQLQGSSRVQATSVHFDQSGYLISHEVTIDLINAGGFGEESRLTVESSSGDSETFEIAETGIYSSTTLSSVAGSPILNDGILQVADGDRLVATYFDEDQALAGKYLIDSVDIYADDHGGNATTATVADFPGTTAGSIILDIDQDWFRFSAVAGLSYVFEI